MPIQSYAYSKLVEQWRPGLFWAENWLYGGLNKFEVHISKNIARIAIFSPKYRPGCHFCTRHILSDFNIRPHQNYQLVETNQISDENSALSDSFKFSSESD